MYIHEHKTWPAFHWDAEALAPAVVEARRMQMHLLGRMASVGFTLRDEANLDTLTLDVVRSSAIEGEILDPGQVRSSLARRLGLEVPGALPADRHVEGVVEMMLDATQKANDKLSAKRLFAWHAALFPTGYSGTQKILVGRWRDDSTGPMQVVSGAMGKERVHYEAPAADRLKAEMNAFLHWVDTEKTMDPILKAGVAHFWFVTLHPFEDGNGRMARAIADLLLARSDGSPQRFYSMSARIRTERKRYYAILESAQRGDMDITAWLGWFLECLLRSIAASEKTLATVLTKHRFWQTHASTTLNPRQVKVLNKLLDGFEGQLSSTKYARITRTSQDTAARDLSDLVKKNVLERSSAGGRSTHYVLAKG